MVKSMGYSTYRVTLLMISIVVHCIRIALRMISIVVQCIGIALLMINILVQCFSSAMRNKISYALEFNS